MKNMRSVPVEIITIGSLRKALKSERSAGKTIALVPTMGYLHEGHLELMRRAKQLADICVVSIFVNPTQFGPSEDLERYPRDIERDRKLAGSVGVDYLFTPTVIEMYPAGYSTYVDVTGITDDLCGRSRPGHFRGVATVVAKFFNIVRPDIAIFGEKDYQQLVVIRRMERDLDMDIGIIGIPTVREPDGLAMSSRNSFLSAEERRAALVLSKSLSLAKELIRNGETDPMIMVAELRELIDTEPLVELEYLELRDPETLTVKEMITSDILVAIAARIGTTRLIDNTVVRANTSKR